MSAGILTIITLQVLTIILLVIIAWAVATGKGRNEHDDTIEISRTDEWPDHTGARR